MVFPDGEKATPFTGTERPEAFVYFVPKPDVLHG
jgi:hypothetical protein